MSHSILFASRSPLSHFFFLRNLFLPTTHFALSLYKRALRFPTFFPILDLARLRVKPRLSRSSRRAFESTHPLILSLRQVLFACSSFPLCVMLRRSHQIAGIASLGFRMLILYAYFLGHLAMRQTELRKVIQLSHPVFLHYTKRANIIYDV